MKTIIITGGSEGLGKELTKLLVKDNNVVILARSEEKLIEVSKECNCDYRVCDVTNWEQVKFVVDDIHIKYNSIDCLINNAGVWIEGQVENNNSGDISNVIDINLKGPIYMTKAVVPYMKEQKSGEIINVNSKVGMMFKAERSVYSATKWGLRGFTGALREDLKSFNIKLVNIYPGKMTTDLFKKVGLDKDFSQAISPTDVAKLVVTIIDQPENTITSEISIGHISE